MSQGESGGPDHASRSRRLSELIGAYQVSAAIGALARLGLADALAAEAATGEELAASLGADEDALVRLLRAVLDVGLFTLGEDGRYRLTELGDLLRSDVAGSLARYAVVSTESWRWDAYGRLAHTLETGEPGFAAVHGRPFWEYLAANPEAAASFEESLGRIATARDQAVAASLDLGGLRHIVDVGAGTGGLLIALLSAHADLRGVLFDQPQMAERARRHVQEAGLDERCEVVAGEVREEVPSGGDAYFLSWILHDWDDATARRILTRCRTAMDAGTRLFVVEMVVPEPGDPAAVVVERLVRQTDLEMLAVVGGRERRADEFEELLAGAGFAVAQMLPLPGLPWSVIEATPV